MSMLSMFTKYRCEISYSSEILALFEQMGWTLEGVTRSSLTFCGESKQTNTWPREGRGVNSRRREISPDVI